MILVWTPGTMPPSEYRAARAFLDKAREVANMPNRKKSADRTASDLDQDAVIHALSAELAEAHKRVDALDERVAALEGSLNMFRPLLSHGDALVGKLHQINEWLAARAGGKWPPE